MVEEDVLLIPILYSPFEKNFVSNGVGRLSECTSCIVTEERNGIYECEFVYPCSGKFYEQLIRQNGIIGVIHDDEHDIQPFEIYRHSDPIDGMVTFNAHHISYRLSNVLVHPFTADSCADAMDGLLANSITENPFTFWTDKSVSATFDLQRTAAVRELLCGQQGSILDVYGKGEYEFDGFTVKLYVNRGLNRGVTIRYGKNMVDFEHTYDESTAFNAIAPYWKNADGSEFVTLPEGMVANTGGVIREYPWEQTENGEYMTDDGGTVIDFRPFILKALPLDMSSYWQEAPTVEELRAAATAYLSNNEPWIPSDNIKIDFVELWQTPEYENVAALQRVKLCDTIAVYYPELLVTNASVKVIKVVYNVLTEQYDSMELGEAKTGIIDFITAPMEMMVTNEIANERAFTQDAIDAATKLITGGLGGYVVMGLNADGQPQEILIMDTDSVDTAVHVIRMNKNGIGFSTTGYEGPFTSAWTIDGAFNADFITSGTMQANRIHGGTLTIGGLNNQAGVLVVRDGSNNEVGRWNNSGITISKGDIELKYGNVIKLPISADETEYAVINTGGMYVRSLDSYLQAYVTYIGSYRSVGWTVRLNANSTTSYSTWIDPFTISISKIVNNSGARSIYCDVENGFYIQDVTNNHLFGYWDGQGQDYFSCTGSVYIGGNLSVSGTKGRVADTSEYGKRTLYCYETPSPIFGDVGEGTLDEDGYCYIFLDAVFADTISDKPYQVFLQKYGEGDCWIAERKGGYFVVRGTAGLSFGWELKAKQAGYDQIRLDRFVDPLNEEQVQRTDYGDLALQFLIELEEGRQAS